MRIVTTQTFTMAGDQLVRTVSQLLDKLPNGWPLMSLTFYPSGKGVGEWEAVVQSPEEDI